MLLTDIDKMISLNIRSNLIAILVLKVKYMPAQNASTSEVFASLGLDPTAIYNTILSLVGTSVNFALWTIQVYWPFYLIAGFIAVLIGLAHRYGNFGSRGGR